MVTVAPVLLAIALAPGSSTYRAVALSVGAGAGLVAGPAIGLWSGGRGDLATRGLLIRIVGAAGIVGGVYGVTVALGEGGSNSASTPLMIAGAAGGLITIVSVVHDLVITPAATARGNALRAELGIRPDGRLAISVRF